MAAIPVTINGVICDLYGRTITGPVKIVGELVRSDVGVGGGPIMPPGGGDGIWGPNDPRPQPPIHIPPGSDVHPEHPIVIPDPPTEPPTNPPDEQGFLKPPPDGGWGYHVTYGWLFNPAEGQAQPKG